MKLVVKVKGSDTTYVLNKDNMTWVRDGRGGLFGNEGKLYSWPEIIVPGKVLTLKIFPAGWLAPTGLNFVPSIVFEVGPHDEEMYGIRIPKSVEERAALIHKHNAPKTPTPVTQADGFAGSSDPLEFATLPTGAKLRYTDETRTTFKYVPKGWTDLGPQDEPRKATVCTRNEGHNGPCNGLPRLEREGLCYNSRPNVLVAQFHSPNGYTTLHLVKGTTVTHIPVRETTFSGQVECIRRNARELQALVYTNSYIFESALNKRGIEARMIRTALLPNGR